MQRFAKVCIVFGGDGNTATQDSLPETTVRSRTRSPTDQDPPQKHKPTNTRAVEGTRTFHRSHRETEPEWVFFLEGHGAVQISAWEAQSRKGSVVTR